MSIIPIPSAIDPPGELIYKLISLSGSSDSKNNNCAITKLDVVGFTSSPKNIILSFNNLYKISYYLSPSNCFKKRKSFT